VPLAWASVPTSAVAAAAATTTAAGDGTQVSGWPPLPPMAVRVALAVR